MGFGSLKDRLLVANPSKSLHWSPELPRILYPSFAISSLFSDLKVIANFPWSSTPLNYTQLTERLTSCNQQRKNAIRTYVLSYELTRFIQTVNYSLTFTQRTTKNFNVSKLPGVYIIIVFLNINSQKKNAHTESFRIRCTQLRFKKLFNKLVPVITITITPSPHNHHYHYTIIHN